MYSRQHDPYAPSPNQSFGYPPAPQSSGYDSGYAADASANGYSAAPQYGGASSYGGGPSPAGSPPAPVPGVPPVPPYGPGPPGYGPPGYAGHDSDLSSPPTSPPAHLYSPPTSPHANSGASQVAGVPLRARAPRSPANQALRGAGGGAMMPTGHMPNGNIVAMAAATLPPLGALHGNMPPLLHSSPPALAMPPGLGPMPGGTQPISIGGPLVPPGGGSFGAPIPSPTGGGGGMPSPSPPGVPPLPPGRRFSQSAQPQPPLGSSSTSPVVSRHSSFKGHESVDEPPAYTPSPKEGSSPGPCGDAPLPTTTVTHMPRRDSVRSSDGASAADGAIDANTVCRHFANGRCTWGDQCRYRHDDGFRDSTGKTTPVVSVRVGVPGSVAAVSQGPVAPLPPDPRVGDVSLAGASTPGSLSPHGSFRGAGSFNSHQGVDSGEYDGPATPPSPSNKTQTSRGSGGKNKRFAHNPYSATTSRSPAHKPASPR